MLPCSWASWETLKMQRRACPCGTHILRESSGSRSRWYCAPCSDTGPGLWPDMWCLASGLSILCSFYCYGSPEYSICSLQPPWPREETEHHIKAAWGGQDVWTHQRSCSVHTHEFTQYPLAIKTSFSSPVAKKGPTCSRRYTHKKQRASSWAVSRSKLHPQRSPLSIEDSVFCIHLIPLEKEKGRGVEQVISYKSLHFKGPRRFLGFRQTYWDLHGLATIILKHPRKKKKDRVLKPSYPPFPRVS